MRGLDPRIHLPSEESWKRMDCRVKPGNDESIFIAAICGIQEEVTMLEVFILVAGFAGGYAGSIYSWPWIRERAIGASAEIAKLRARAKVLEDQIKGAL
jgi:hypothetical protein